MQTGGRIWASMNARTCKPSPIIPGGLCHTNTQWPSAERERVRLCQCVCVCIAQWEVIFHQASRLYLGSQCLDVHKPVWVQGNTDSHTQKYLFFRKKQRPALPRVPTTTTHMQAFPIYTPCMPVCDQWTPCLHMNTYAVTRIYPTPFTPSPPAPRSWLLCCCHGDTKPCTLKSALRRSRGETDNNIPISRQTDTHTHERTNSCVCEGYYN